MIVQIFLLLWRKIDLTFADIRRIKQSVAIEKQENMQWNYGPTRDVSELLYHLHRS